MQDTALILIETQQEWFTDGGKLRPLMDGAALDRTRESIARLLGAARDAGLPIFHAHLGFQPGHPELGHAEVGLRHAMRRHDVWTGEGRAAAPGLEPLPGELRVAGRTGGSAFAGSNLDSVLRNNGVERLIVAGLAAHVCVLATAIQAHDLGYTVVLPREATMAFTEEQHRVALDGIASHFASVKPLDATLDHLARRAGVTAALGRFFSALEQADAAAASELIDPEITVEGVMDGRWCRWDRAHYLERVAGFGGAVQSARIVRMQLVGRAAEVDTHVELPHGAFFDRLSWSEDGDRWLLRHKSFLFRPQLATAHP